MTTGIMVDFETLSTKNNAFILEVGIVAFSMDTFAIKLEDEFAISPVGQEDRHISFNTLQWWTQHSLDQLYSKIYNCKYSLDIINLPDLILYFEQIYDEFKKKGAVELWANSPSFDLRILANIFNTYNKTPIWFYGEERDVRTIVNLDPSVKELYKNNHNALSDCKNQIKQIEYILKKNREK